MTVVGLRESKKRATRARIAAAGLRLFLEHGYDATTLDEIAAAAKISRRTFFYYFASKDDVLLEWHGAGAVSLALGPTLLEQPPDQRPIDAAQRCLVDLAARYETDESRAMDALMRSSEALRVRKDASELQMERQLGQAMETLWPDPDRRTELRLTAAMAIGALRIALDDWRQDTTNAPLATHLQHTFTALTQQLAPHTQ